MDEVVLGLFIGDGNDCVTFGPDNHLCVLEGPCSRGDWIQVLDPGAGRARKDWLDKAADWIETHRHNGHRVLVHCGAGIERSPLVVTWFLARRMGLDEAWKLVQQKRPQAQDRRSWIPP